MAKNETKSKTVSKSKANNRFKLLDDIKDNDLYKAHGRDPKARDIIESEIKNAKKSDIVAGQLMMFKYLNPKTKEELPFYDAYPCTIFFGVFNSSQGRRVLGFNIHYLPPQLRFLVMDRVFEIYRPVYMKYFDGGLSHEMDAFDYQYIIDELSKIKLDWTVRMYDPTLIGDVRIIPPKYWSTALFTEGWFKKDTRAHIMQLFKQESKKSGKQHTTRGIKYKRKKS